jgi:hypothetical protein
MSYGIAIADENEAVETGHDIHRSDRPRLQIAMDRKPGHTGIEFVQGTALQVFAAGAHTASEVLFRMDHGLKYKPRAFAYFNALINKTYAAGTYFYNFGAVDDYITYETTDKEFRIVHKLVDNTGFTDYTSLAPATGRIRAKRLIFSNPIDAKTDANARG